MAQIEVKVIFDVKGGVSADSVCASATEAGLKVERLLPDIGAIFGSCDEADLRELAKLEGVLRVAPEGRFKLPPMSKDIPQ